MRNSSTRQQEFDFIGMVTANTAGISSSSSFRDAGENTEVEAVGSAAARGTTGDLSLPNFGEAKNLYAIAARRAARLNAATITDEERDRWLTERMMLVDKEIDETITQAERVRLEYVRWQLDRIEDAR